jgi:hypothetical protein
LFKKKKKKTVLRRRTVLHIQNRPTSRSFYETTQLGDKNETRLKGFRQDLQNYLGLTEELPPPIHFKPARKVPPGEQEIRD